MSVKKFANAFYWITHHINQFVRKKKFGKLEISFHNGVVVNLKVTENLKPKDHVTEVEYEGMTVAFQEEKPE